MPPDSLDRFLPWPCVSSVRWALLAWGVVLVAVCGRGVYQPRARTLYPTWVLAGSDWMSGTNLYHHQLPSHIDVYRYGPPVAVLMTPFALMPEGLGSVVWRLLNAAVLIAGFAWWLRSAVPKTPTAHEVGLLYLFLLPLALSSLNNAQPNPLLVGLMLAGIAACVEKRWTVAAFCLTGPVVLKLYPLALALILVLLYPRQLLPRLLLALAALAALPFLFQEPDYVMRQYTLWWVERLRAGDEARRFWPLHATYRDLWLLFRVAQIPIDLLTYHAIQGVSALVCAAVALLARWWCGPTRAVLLLVLVLASCWMMLCGPATESSTYVLLAPCLIYTLVLAWHQPWPPTPRWLVTTAALILLLSVLAGVLPWVSSLHGLGIHPLATLLFLAGYARMAWQTLSTDENRTPVQEGQDELPKINLESDPRAA